MKINNNVTYTQYTEDDFIIDILEYPEKFETWIRQQDAGVSMLMFGTPKKQRTLEGEEYIETKESVLEMVEINLTEYIQQYLEDYLSE